MFLATIPAVLYVDRFGRKTILIVGGIGMAISHFIVAGIVGAYHTDWPAHRGAGWVAVVFVWLYAIHFGYVSRNQQADNYRDGANFCFSSHGAQSHGSSLVRYFRWV